MAPRYLTEVLQHKDELAWLIELFKRQHVESYLEIGSWFGGSLWAIGSALPKGARIVSIDMVAGSDLQSCVADLMSIGMDASLLAGNSVSPDILQKVTAFGPFDACLIDGDHSLAGVVNDWENYGPLARLVAFHDIAWYRGPKWKGGRIDVPQFWNCVKRYHRHEECRLCPSKKNNGIGVLWRD